MALNIFYTLQKDDEQSWNCFQLPQQFSNENELKIKDVVSYFPLNQANKSYHFRFQTICSEAQPQIKAWLDISNLNAKPPVVNKTIYMKVLEVPYDRASKSHNTTTFTNQNEEINKPVVQQSESPTKKSPEKLGSRLIQSEQLKKQPTDLINENVVHKKVTVIQKDLWDIHEPSSAKITNHKPKEIHHQHSNSQNTISTGSNQFFKPSSSHNASFVQKDFISFDNDNNEPSNISLTKVDRSKFDPSSLSEEEKKRINQQVQIALQATQQNWENIQKEQDEKFIIAQELEPKIKNWAKRGEKRNNIRTLLQTVHTVLWQDAEWKPCSLTDLVEDSQVKKIYMKIIRMVHPDKNQSVPIRQKYISERVFHELNEAFKDHRDFGGY